MNSMKFVALVSGGKDSIYTIMRCQHFGHELVCIANLSPPHTFTGDELNSYMYQSAAYNVIPQIAECLGVPLVRRFLQGTSLAQSMTYEYTPGDEVEDLFELLKEVKLRYPEVEGVSCGAIISNYQRHRLENVCLRLELLPLTFLWQRKRCALLREMLDAGVDAILVKVAAAGLDPFRHLGQHLSALFPTLQRLNDRFQVDMCGEGGEYESIVLDCPAYKFAHLRIDASEVVVDSEDSSVGNLRILSASLIPKTPHTEANCVCETRKSDTISAEETRQVASSTYIATCPVISFGRHLLATPLISPTPLTSAAEPPLYVSAAVASLRSALAALQCAAQRQVLEIAFVRLYVAGEVLSNEMFVELNCEYSRWFDSFPANTSGSPPARTTIAVSGLPCPVAVDAVLVHCSGICNRRALHVRSISEWAPVSIGPYAQCNSIADTFSFVAGQIGLVPATMQMCRPDADDVDSAMLCELRQALANAANVLSATNSKYSLTISIAVILRKDIATAREDASALMNQIHRTILEFQQHTRDGEEEDAYLVPVVTIFLADDLPRHALVEVELMALCTTSPLATEFGVKYHSYDLQGTKSLHTAGAISLPCSLEVATSSLCTGRCESLSARGLFVARFSVHTIGSGVEVDAWACMHQLAATMKIALRETPLHSHACISLRLLHSNDFARDELLLALGSSICDVVSAGMAKLLLQAVTAFPVTMLERDCLVIAQMQIIDLRRIESDAWIFGVSS